MQKPKRTSCAHGASIIGTTIMALLLTVLSGCGNFNSDETVLRAFVDGGCSAESSGDIELSELVILDWDGGVNRIYPDRSLSGLDFAAFPLEDGGTLADRAEEFMQDVRDQVAAIYCERDDISLRVINGDDSVAQGIVTVVHITQDSRPGGGTDVGEGEYDPCNEEADNAAIVFGERVRSLSKAYSYGEWVNVFANIAAHEIGHTFGFGHVDRNEFVDLGRTLYVELMLSGHTMAELRRPNRFVVDLPNCPANAKAGVVSSKATQPCRLLGHAH